MSILTKIKQKSQELDEWERKRDREESDKERKRDDLDFALYQSLKCILMELDGQKIQGHKITIRESGEHTRSRALFMNIGGHPHIKFTIKRVCKVCDCGANDGMCNHPNTDVRTIVVKDCGWAKDPDDYEISVSELQEYEITEDKLANCILRWIDDYERRY